MGLLDGADDPLNNGLRHGNLIVGHSGAGVACLQRSGQPFIIGAFVRSQHVCAAGGQDSGVLISGVDLFGGFLEDCFVHAIEKSSHGLSHLFRVTGLESSGKGSFMLLFDLCEQVFACDFHLFVPPFT